MISISLYIIFAFYIQLNYIKADYKVKHICLTGNHTISPSHTPSSYFYVNSSKCTCDIYLHVFFTFVFQLDSLKSDLRDVLYSHKWTPDAYLLAKAYIAEDDAKEQDKTLPKLTLKNPSRKL